MNNPLHHFTRRTRYLLICAIVLVLITGVLAWLLSHVSSGQNPSIGVLALQCLICVPMILLALTLISLPFRFTKSKFVLAVMFVCILWLGMFVYSNVDQSDASIPYFFRQVITPLNNALDSFLPTGGHFGMNDGHVRNKTAYLLFHALTYFYVTWLGFSFFGRTLLDLITYIFLRSKDKTLIWGYSEGGLELAKSMLKQPDMDEPVFVLDTESALNMDKERRLVTQIANDGILTLYIPFDGLSIRKEDFAKGLFHLGRLRRIIHPKKYLSAHSYYFITEDQDLNVKYALRVLQQLALQQDNLKLKRHIYVRTEQEGVDVFFQEHLNKGDLANRVEVHLFNQSDITARYFTQQHPLLNLSERINPKTDKPWLTIDHTDLSVSGQINILLLGLGWTGFEILRKQICDVQYRRNYQVNVVVVDNDYQNFHGRYQYIVKDAARLGVYITINPIVWFDRHHTLCKQWLSDRPFEQQKDLDEQQVHQANSHLFYEWLDYTDPAIGMPNMLYFNRIIVALGADELNVYTALQLARIRNRYLGAQEANDPKRMPEPICAHVRDKERYSYYQEQAHAPIQIFGDLKSLYNVDNLVNEKMDVIPKFVNYAYANLDAHLSKELFDEALRNGSVEKAWASCTIFEQDSNRAVASHLSNMEKLAGSSEALTQMVQNRETMELLAEIEHKRWNAFHYMRCIGCWPIEEVVPARNAKGELTCKGKLYLSGTLVRHIGIVPFGQLEQASAKLSELAGKSKDLKQADRQIISYFPLFYAYNDRLKTTNNSTNNHPN